MGTHPPPKALLHFLRPFRVPVRKLALSMRRLVLSEMEPCVESIYDAYNALALGYGPTGRMNDGICHIAIYARHVNLGFNHGAQLEDPRGILQGSGKWIRHITVREAGSLNPRVIRDYLRRALQQAASRPAAALPPKESVSIIKGISPIKRRPGKTATPGKKQRRARGR